MVCESAHEMTSKTHNTPSLRLYNTNNIFYRTDQIIRNDRPAEYEMKNGKRCRSVHCTEGSEIEVSKSSIRFIKTARTSLHELHFEILFYTRKRYKRDRRSFIKFGKVLNRRSLIDASKYHTRKVKHSSRLKVNNAHQYMDFTFQWLK